MPETLEKDFLKLWRRAGTIWVGASLVALGEFGPACAQAPGPSAAPATTQRVQVNRFRVTGSTIFPAEELERLVASEQGKALTVAEMEVVAGRITALYRARGHILARAVLPAQEIREGVVEIRVLEGRIGNIEVQGARRYSAEFLRSHFPSPPAVFHADSFERSLLLVNDLPGLEVRSTLTPGTDVGTTDVVVHVERERLITGSIEANNFGSQNTGRGRFGLSLNLNNPFGWADVASFRFLASSDDLKLYRLSYTKTLGTWGSKVGAAYTLVDSEVGGKFAELGILGAGEVMSLFAAHPFIRTRALSLYGHVGFDYKDFATEALDVVINKDRLRVATAGIALNAIDGFRGLTTFGLTVHHGIGDFLGGLRANNDPRASREGAGGSFTKVTGEVSRLQQIYGATSLFARAGGQWASTELVAPEQYSIGGYGTVRGYPLTEFAGDYGYSTTLEFRWNAPGFSTIPAFGGKTWGDVFQAFLFIDHGGIAIRNPAPFTNRVEDLTGLGLGFRFTVPGKVHGSVEYARTLEGPRPSDKIRNVIYVQLVTWF